MWASDYNIGDRSNAYSFIVMYAPYVVIFPLYSILSSWAFINGLNIIGIICIIIILDRFTAMRNESL